MESLLFLQEFLKSIDPQRSTPENWPISIVLNSVVNNRPQHKVLGNKLQCLWRLFSRTLCCSLSFTADFKVLKLAYFDVISMLKNSWQGEGVGSVPRFTLDISPTPVNSRQYQSVPHPEELLLCHYSLAGSWPLKNFVLDRLNPRRIPSLRNREKKSGVGGGGGGGWFTYLILHYKVSFATKLSLSPPWEISILI